MGAKIFLCKGGFPLAGHRFASTLGKARNDSEIPRHMSNAEEMKTDEVLLVELEVFRREHRDLDDAIAALEAAGRADQLRLRRLKKQKLALKDKISRIEDKLTPDIIA